MLAAFAPGVASRVDFLQSRPEGGAPCGKEVDGKICGKNTLTHQRDFACGDIPERLPRLHLERLLGSISCNRGWKNGPLGGNACRVYTWSAFWGRFFAIAAGKEGSTLRQRG